MKKFLYLALFAATSLTACDDNLSTIGGSIRPDSDNLSFKMDTLTATIRTVPVGSVYARTHQPLLGTISDPVYGDMEADFMAEFYSPDNFKFHDSIANNKLDSVIVRLFYNKYWGDSKSIQQISLYQLNKRLGTNYYSDVDPTQYYTPSSLLATSAYTIDNLGASDSLKAVSGYVPQIRFKLNDHFAQDFYQKVINNREIFTNADSFNEYFKGIYLKNAYGRGIMLQVGYVNEYGSTTSVEMLFHYKIKSKTTAGKDTLTPYASVIPVTNMAVQSNRFKSGQFDISDKNYQYIQSPAGTAIEMDFPIGKLMSEEIQKSFINNIKYTFKIASPHVGETKLTPPTYLMLIKKDRIKEFFENRENIGTSTGTYSATYNSTDFTYTFNNFNMLIESEIEKRKNKPIDPNEILTLSIIPIQLSATSSGTVTSVSHNFIPTGIRIISDQSTDGIKTRQLPIIISRYNNR